MINHLLVFSVLWHSTSRALRSDRLNSSFWPHFGLIRAHCEVSQILHQRRDGGLAAHLKVLKLVAKLFDLLKWQWPYFAYVRLVASHEALTAFERRFTDQALSGFLIFSSLIELVFQLKRDRLIYSFAEGRNRWASLKDRLLVWRIDAFGDWLPAGEARLTPECIFGGSLAHLSLLSLLRVHRKIALEVFIELLYQN